MLALQATHSEPSKRAGISDRVVATAFDAAVSYRFFLFNSEIEARRFENLATSVAAGTTAQAFGGLSGDMSSDGLDFND